jgi:hypothetical protein
MARKDIIASARNDSIGIFLEVDALAPERYREVFHSRQISPEERLMMAVLDDAVQSFLAGIRPRRFGDLRHLREAEEWIMASDGDGLCSFDSICNLLGLDPAYLRSGLEKLKAEARAEQRSCRPRSNCSRPSEDSPGNSAARSKKTGGSRRVFPANYNPES